MYENFAATRIWRSCNAESTARDIRGAGYPLIMQSSNAVPYSTFSEIMTMGRTIIRQRSVPQYGTRTSRASRAENSPRIHWMLRQVTAPFLPSSEKRSALMRSLVPHRPYNGDNLLKPPHTVILRLPNLFIALLTKHNEHKLYLTEPRLINSLLT